MQGKTCLVTGATRGIGRATAEALARMGAMVIVHGRNGAAVTKVCETVRRVSKSGSVTGVVADFSSLDDVRRLAAEIDYRHERIDVLINNAGIGAAKRKLTSDGFELQIAVNHLAPFVLTNLLLGKLRASAPARIVNVASMAYRRGALDLDDLSWERRRYNAWQAYGASKLANILFTQELARRLEGSGVTANSLHPGVVATNIFSNLGLAGRVFGFLARPLLLSPDDGAKTSVYLATSPDVADISGKFFDECREVELSPGAADADLALRLWQRSAAITGLG